MRKRRKTFWVTRGAGAYYNGFIFLSHGEPELEDVFQDGTEWRVPNVGKSNRSSWPPVARATLTRGSQEELCYEDWLKITGFSLRPGWTAEVEICLV